MTDSGVPVRPPQELLAEAWDSRKLAHGLVLYGPSIEALEETALNLAARILNESEERVLRHPDFTMVRPINKMRQIGADPMRDLVRTLSHSSNQGGGKVAVILEADRMNVSASNVFLKTLEEPPPDTFLLLLTIRPNDLLDTIRSRCLAFRVPGKIAMIEHPAWKEWRDLFRFWLARSETPPKGKAAIAETVLRLYGLVQRFQEVQDQIGTGLKEKNLEELPEDVSDEERLAIESGTERGLRRQMFADIEETMRDFALENIANDPLTAERARKLVQTVAATESTTGLLDVNFQPVAAVEYLMIRILRIWSRRD